MSSRQGDASVADAMTEKWGAGVAETGFTQIPNYLIGANQYLSKEEQISPTEFLVLMQLLQSWWRADQFPFPSKATLARRTGIGERQVQRALASLEKKSLIERESRHLERGGRASNRYNLSGLVALTQRIAEVAAANSKVRGWSTIKEKAPIISD